MKKIIIILLLINTKLLGQLDITAYSNYLLVGPQNTQELNFGVIEYYIEEYVELKSWLEEEYKSSENIFDKEDIELDLKLIEEFIIIWREELSDDKTSEFLNKGKGNKCYEIWTNKGYLNKDEYEIKLEEKKEQEITEIFQLTKEVKPEKWIKYKYTKEERFKSSKKKNRYKERSPFREVVEKEKLKGPGVVGLKPEEIVYVMNLNKNDQEIEVELYAIPDNYEYNEEEGQLERKIEIVSLGIVVSKKETHEKVKIESWQEISCEK